MKKLRENMKKLRENIYLILAIGLVAIVVGFLTAAWFGCSQDPGTGYEAPSSAHWLGCRGSGADLARYTGAAVVRSVSLAVVVSVAVVFLGFVAGGMWALVGNRSAHGLAWHVMVLGLLGPTPLIVSIGTLFVFPDPGSFIAFVTAIGLGAVGPVALRMREEVSRLANQPWVRIAREEGLGTWATLWQQVWPGARPFLRSLAVLTCIGVVTTDTALGLCARGRTLHPSVASWKMPGRPKGKAEVGQPGGSLLRLGYRLDWFWRAWSHSGPGWRTGEFSAALRRPLKGGLLRPVQVGR